MEGEAVREAEAAAGGGRQPNDGGIATHAREGMGEEVAVGGAQREGRGVTACSDCALDFAMTAAPTSCDGANDLVVRKNAYGGDSCWTDLCINGP